MDDTETRVRQDKAAGPGRREWRILAVVLVGSFMAVLDTTIVNVALPSIAQGIRASSEALEWVVSGYALTFGLALVPAGRLGDRLGYKRMFLAGLIGPLFLAGLSNGLVIAPNQDFVLSSVPKHQAGTAGGALITAQRIGAAIGIAVIGTALFGSGSGGQSGGGQGSSAGLMPSLVHTAQTATAVNLAFVLAAWLCTFGLPRTLSAERAEENA